MSFNVFVGRKPCLFSTGMLAHSLFSMKFPSRSLLIAAGLLGFTGVVLGAVVGTWPDAAIVDPGGNGSQHISHYPPELAGRRPPGLPGSDNKAGTREHTRSAYDVAGKAAKTLYPRTSNPLEMT